MLDVVANNIYVSGIILAVFSAILGVFISKILERLSVFGFTVQTSKLGLTADNSIHGKVEVHHKGNVLPNFYFSNVIVRNMSSRDHENVTIMFYVNTGVVILSDFAIYEKAVGLIPYSASYQEIMKVPGADLQFTRREYTIPVFNRGQQVKIELTLTTREEIDWPVLFASMVHKGAKLVEVPNVISYHGVPVLRTFPWAIYISLFILLLICTYEKQVWIVGPICLILGFFAQSVSAYCIKFFDWIGRKIGIIPDQS